MNLKITLNTISIIIVGGLFIYTLQLNNPPNTETIPKITNFEECITAGNPAMESHPRQCNDGENNFIEDISTKCTKDQRETEICTAIYQPVCATVNVQCITAPCDPVKETFASPCVACSNTLVESYVPGECF